MSAWVYSRTGKHCSEGWTVCLAGCAVLDTILHAYPYGAQHVSLALRPTKVRKRSQKSVHNMSCFATVLFA